MHFAAIVNQASKKLNQVQDFAQWIISLVFEVSLRGEGGSITHRAFFRGKRLKATLNLKGVW